MDKVKLKDISIYRSQIYGFMMIWIILYHVINSFDHNSIIKPIQFFLENGNKGVDVFLFISGISLYYAMQKRKIDKVDIKVCKDFYKQRFYRIFLIYVLVLIPFFIFKDILLNKDILLFIKDSLFISLFYGTKLRALWYLLAISIDYLIYPILYACILNKKEKWIIIGTIIWILCCFAFQTYIPTLFEYYEIILTRIPIFIIGCLFSKYVYEEKEISIVYIVSIFIVCIFQYFLLHNYENIIIQRLLDASLGFSVLFVYLYIYKRIQILSTFIKFTGTITLELYIVHIILRYCILFMLHRYNVSFESISTINLLIFMLVLTISSYIGAILINKVLTFIQRKRAI